MNSKFANMDSEIKRMETFKHFPNSTFSMTRTMEMLNTQLLAKSGMYYTGYVDKCKCHFCDVEISTWELNDCPVGEHMRFSQNCPLLRHRKTTNVPIDRESLQKILPPHSYDVCGNEDSFVLGFSGSRNSPYSVGGGNGGLLSLDDVLSAVPTLVHCNTNSYSSAVLTNAIPKYPGYAYAPARLRTFHDWSRSMTQTPQAMSEAGFFYRGMDDAVKCFSCGGGLKDWDPGDLPWEQHALWLKNCSFLKRIKGQAYIDNVQRTQRPNIPNSIENNFINSLPNCEEDQTAKPITPEHSDLEEAVDDDSNTAKGTKNKGKDDDEEKLCKICFESEYNTIFIPCGHIVSCENCASALIKCPVCRMPYAQIQKIYFP